MERLGVPTTTLGVADLLRCPVSSGKPTSFCVSAVADFFEVILLELNVKDLHGSPVSCWIVA